MKRLLTLAALLAAGGSYGFVAQIEAQQIRGAGKGIGADVATGAREAASAVRDQPLRLFFMADAHSRHARLDRFIADANLHQPDLVLDGGDFVHDGTEPEFRRALAERARLEVEWHLVRGNHDAELRGPFSAPAPAIPRFTSLERRGVRFILLDNHDGTLDEAQFQRLEEELAANAGGRTIVVMHVPALLGRETLLARARRLLPYRLASPVMHDAGQVERFTALMERHGVLAVLAGHAHHFDHVIRGGVHYIVAGALGGLTPGLGIPNEYLDITIDGRELGLRRVLVADPARDPVSFAARAFRFYADLNGFIHREQGWNHVPSASVQLRSGLSRIETSHGESLVVSGAAAFERVLGRRGAQSLTADVGASGGRRDLAAHLAIGYRLRPAGSFNRNLFLAGATTANAGMFGSRATAGVGAQLGAGLEWRNGTAELSRNWATNHRATSVVLGYRF